MMRCTVHCSITRHTRIHRRYLSFTLTEGYGELSLASKEVGLTDEASVLLSKALALANTLDRQFQIIPKVKAALTFVASKLAFLVTRVKQDIDDRRTDGD